MKQINVEPEGGSDNLEASKDEVKAKSAEEYGDSNRELEEDQHSHVPKMAHFVTLEAEKVNNEVNSNSLDGLDSFVVDSAMVNKAQCDIEKNLVPNAMSDQKQDGNINVLPLIEPLEIDSRNYPRASQIEGINLLADLRPAKQRKRIRTQVYEACMSSWESESIQNSTLSVKARTRTSINNFSR